MNPKETTTPREAELGPLEGDEADDDLAALCKALGHPARVRIVRILSRQERCMCGEIVGQIDLAQSTVSQHLQVLKEAGLIRGEIEGARVSYGLDPRALRRMRALVVTL
jgi:ArsR family transcriptional regulator